MFEMYEVPNLEIDGTEKFINYIIAKKHKKFCYHCKTWHENQDTYKPCCYKWVSWAGKLWHYEELAQEIIGTNE